MAATAARPLPVACVSCSAMTVQIAKRNEQHALKVTPNAGSWSAALPGWRNAEGCGETASASSMPVCSLSGWLFGLFCLKDHEQDFTNSACYKFDSYTRLVFGALRAIGMFFLDLFFIPCRLQSLDFKASDAHKSGANRFGKRRFLIPI